MEVFQAKQLISETDARRMIMDMAFHGNHFNDIQGQLKTTADVKAHMRQSGRSFSDVVRTCRDFSKPVPLYENLIGAQSTTQGVTISRPSHVTGKYEPVITGDGVINERDYWATFELSREDFELTLKHGKPGRFLSSVNAGIASIEAFLNDRYLVHKRVGSEAPALRNPLDWKIKIWPAELEGRSFDLSRSDWERFVKLRKLRNEDFQHRKSTSSGITHSRFCSLINEYRDAIPRLLYNLHVHFSVRCPCTIIRYSYFPKVRFVDAGDA